MDANVNQYQYCINGVNVKFPVKAYPTQISLMSKILQSIQKRQCCLLESPTGSGKSLALLCASLAWLYEEKNSEFESTVEKENVTNNIQVDNMKQENKNTTTLKEDSDDDDFKRKPKKARKGSPSLIQDNIEPECKVVAQNAPIENPLKTSVEKRKKISKIYFGTRTHKQITQIIRELKKTAYKDVKMSILGSREYTCIHPTVSKNINKSEECKKLVQGQEGKSCRFYNNVHLFSKYAVQQQCNLNTAWDIEDLVTAGKKKKACPYFGARELSRVAEIIFCPFNYLIDPVIRNQMSININGDVVILDEAHNIEDASREAASSVITILELEEAKLDLQYMIATKVINDSYTCLMLLCDGMLFWIESVKDQLEQRGFEDEAKVWTGKEIIKMFQETEKLRLSCASVKLYKDQLIELTNVEQQDNTNTFGESEIRISSKTLNTILNLMKVLEKLFDDNYDYSNDYRAILSRTAVMVDMNNESVGGWKRKSKSQQKVWTYEIKWCCLNPAVVFAEIGLHSRCVILTSGTLSPMSSFASELGVDFPITYEGNHIIADSQVWVGTLSVGPSGNVINANYKNSETFSFQDDIGNILLQLCQAIPRGILCFLPSYHMMEKLHKRWEMTGLLDKMAASKDVFFEPRGTEKKGFDETLRQFYECAMLPDNDITGALLLAVCRGKVSEGLDFSDDNARAVVAVGIPFPNVKDLSVMLKRKYNDLYTSKGLLSGNDWYQLQAFRALNQALGRCLRHKNDWGALLMVDVRFSKTPKYVGGLSKWIRTKIKHFNDFQTCFLSVSDFAYSHQQGCSSKNETSIFKDGQKKFNGIQDQFKISESFLSLPSCFDACKRSEVKLKNISSTTVMNKLGESISKDVSFYDDNLNNERILVDKSSNGNEQSQKDLCESKVSTKKCFSFRTPNSKFTSKYAEDRISFVNSPSPTKDASSSFDKLSGHESIHKFNKFQMFRTPEKTLDNSIKSAPDSIFDDTTTSTSVTKSITTIDNQLLNISIAPFGRSQKLCPTLSKRNFVYPVSDSEKVNQTNCKELVCEKMSSTSNLYSEFKQSINYHNYSNPKQHSTPNIYLVNSSVDCSFHEDTSVVVDESTQDLFSQEPIERDICFKTSYKENISQKLEQTDFTDRKSDVNLKDKKKKTDNHKNQVNSYNLRIEENQSIDSCQTLLSGETSLARKFEDKNNKFTCKAVKNIHESNEDETKDFADVKLAKKSVSFPKQTESLAVRRKKRGYKRILRETQKTKDEMKPSPEFHSLSTDVRSTLVCATCKLPLVQGDFEDVSELLLSKKVFLLKKSSPCIQFNDTKSTLNGFRLNSFFDEGQLHIPLFCPNCAVHIDYENLLPAGVKVISVNERREVKSYLFQDRVSTVS